NSKLNNINLLPNTFERIWAVIRALARLHMIAATHCRPDSMAFFKNTVMPTLTTFAIIDALFTIFLVTFPTAPHTKVTEKGDVIYSEVVREGVRKLGMMFSNYGTSLNHNQEQTNCIKITAQNARTLPRNRRSSSQFICPQVTAVTSVSADTIPFLHLKRKIGTTWEYSSNLTGV
ncbi:hypothetical protein JOM56_004917, partial [Amanita muscaria]